MTNSVRPVRVRQHPPEVRCWIFTGRRSRSAWLFVQGMAKSVVEPQDHVLVAVKPANQGAGLPGEFTVVTQ